MASTVLGFGSLSADPQKQIELPDFAACLAAPTAGVYFRTVRHLRARQAVSLVCHRIFRSRKLRTVKPCRVELKKLLHTPGFPEWQPAAALRMIETREFDFLNVRQERSNRILWSATGFERLWLYHLNYFDFLNVDFSVRGRHALLPEALELALDWCNQNATGAEVGWDSYPLSMRIVNWLKFLVRNAPSCASASDRQAISTLLGSLRDQTLALEGRLEMDIMANHLLKNGKALMFAGALLESPESARWWSRGERLLAKELREQILSDGGHFERSPMYHAQVLEDLLDLQALGAACDREIRCGTELMERITRMAAFLQEILHPDGEIPLFNDAVFGMTSPAADILSRCRDAIKQRLGPRPQMTVFGRTGYAVIRDPGAGGCMIFDCGPLGPDYQPGHGHCDILSYELSLHSRRVIVDTGVSTYERGEDRHYERSTAAHNTVRVDGKDQAEIWASFRVGRRPKIGAIESGVLAGCRFVRAEYSGCQAPGVVHRRTIYHIPQRSWLVVDSLRGKGRHRIESFIHFHPGVVIEPCDERPERNGDITRRRLIRFGSYSYWLMVAGEGDVRLRQSWYSPEFGLRQRRSTVHWSLEGLLPVFMIYGFVPADGGPVTFRKNNDAESIQINQFTLPLA